MLLCLVELGLQLYNASATYTCNTTTDTTSLPLMKLASLFVLLMPSHGPDSMALWSSRDVLLYALKSSDLPSMYLRFFAGTALVALQPRCSLSGDCSLAALLFAMLC